jgi:hypothetical protein
MLGRAARAVDDATTSLPSHVGQYGAGHANNSEEVRIEDRLGLFDRTLFRCSRRNTEAGVVHQQIDPAFPTQKTPDSGIEAWSRTSPWRLGLSRGAVVVQPDTYFDS